MADRRGRGERGGQCMHGADGRMGADEVVGRTGQTGQKGCR